MEQFEKEENIYDYIRDEINFINIINLYLYKLFEILIQLMK